MFLTREFPRGNQFAKPLLDPIRKGIQALENAGLVERKVRNIGGSTVSSARLGLQAIEKGTARKYLGAPASQ